MEESAVSGVLKLDIFYTDMLVKTGTSPTGQKVFSSCREISPHVTHERVFPNVLYADPSGKKKYPVAFHIFLRKPSVSWKWD